MRRFVWPLIGVVVLVGGVWLIDRAQGPDVGSVTLNGVPGTVLEYPYPQLVGRLPPLPRDTLEVAPRAPRPERNLSTARRPG